MGRGPTLEETQREAFLEQAERYFEPLLIKSGLGKDQITKQSLSELRESLQLVNRLIENPSYFGFYNVKVTSGLTLSSAQAEAQLGILPILLERKKLILDRIRLLGGEEIIEKMTSKAEEQDETALKQEMVKLSSEMEKLRHSQRKLSKNDRWLSNQHLPHQMKWLVERKKEKLLKKNGKFG